jgi:hypothetical protein
MPACQTSFTVIPKLFGIILVHCSGTIYTLAWRRGRIYHALAPVPERSYDKSL